MIQQGAVGDLEAHADSAGTLEKTPTNMTDAKLGQTETHKTDAVFGEITDAGPDYRNVGWIGTTILMMKTQVGLGVLSVPAVFDTLGIVPGIICLLIIAVTSSWANRIVGLFKLKHPEVYGIDDAGYMMFGRFGREFFGLIFSLFFACVAGSGMLSFAIGLNAVSTHGACTAIFVAIGAVVGWGCGSVQTLGKMAWIAWVGVISIFVAVFSLTIAVGVQDRPAAAPPGTVWKSDYKIVNNPSFAQASSALTSLVFAYAGTPAYFNIVAEMRDPRMYTRALVVSQSITTALYITIGVVVYYYCGSYVASPALGSAGAVMKKVSYGIALPGLIVGVTLSTHYTAKYIFVRLLRGSEHLSGNTVKHWVYWLSCTLGVAIFAYVIASAIPVFGSLVSLVGALLGTLLIFQPMGCMWFYDNWSEGKEKKSLKWILMVCWSTFIIIGGTFLTISGTYGSVIAIIEDYRATGGSAAWSCADNSNST
ncbi:putative amino acid transporter [Aaosphaeria arxii CBS 175.79]|uniref:Putative amino acid transporter n=1 Tax=Aaosphaeria arxii CBS 175.79 TaxID=1450172 RepID=A0A6A5YA51_9PLEO|nr:putative amino acid transporter [Aaosphaeria arxii CBS 175.79]KAF2021631.1 putative amino acid transporter [Aaosphaeria arxii CBS 175.79]